ncbi:hypothetical protein TIFTF001_019222 [Ficus carica]|uniref:Serine-threonine kinase receptor-associated protein n=1 Tax=Ficus carica TaxID=3494 RepID=A0AA88ADZ5_FICCA|nr:hypothetical protein TIFTF001_019222 [Ficus carica]
MLCGVAALIPMPHTLPLLLQIILLWNASTGQELYSFEHEDIVRSCAFSELEPHLLLTGCEKKLRVFDLNRPETPRVEIDQYSFGRVRTVAWLPNGYNILSSSTERNHVRIWDIRAGHYTLKTLQTTSPGMSVEVSRDGGYINTANGSAVSFWDANGFGLMKSYTKNYNVVSDSLEPTSAKRFIAGGEDVCVRLFNFEEGKEIECNNHIGAVHCVRFSSGGESYASGSDDGNGTIMLWEMDPVRHRDEADALDSDGMEADARDSDAPDSDSFEADAHDSDCSEADANDSDGFEDSDCVEADVHDSNAHDCDGLEADAHDSDDEDNGRNKMGSWIFCKLGACSVL